MSWFSSILFGLISGLAEVLPVSAQAHRVIILSLMGEGKTHVLTNLFLHMGTLAALFYCLNHHILRLTRAQKLARIPKRRRKRPLDTRSLMDLSLLRTTLVPIILVFFVYNKIAVLNDNLIAIAGFLFLNGLILYIPQFLPGSNRDARSLSRVDGLIIGLGGAASVIPGISCVGTAVSVATVRGADRQYSLNIALLMLIPVTIGMLAMDILAVVETGIAGITFGMVMVSVLAGAAAFVGVMLGIRLLRILASNIGFSVFTFYCWGMSLFTFIFYLTAA